MWLGSQFRRNGLQYFSITVKKPPPYTLAGFDLTTHIFSLLGGRRYHLTTPPGLYSTFKHKSDNAWLKLVLCD
jgi:hypothetical protein